MKNIGGLCIALIIIMSLSLCACSIIKNHNSFIVSFDTKGGSEIDPIRVKKGQSVTLPDNPYREGFIFEGWYIDQDLLHKFAETEKISESITLYAKWTCNHTPVNDDAIEADCENTGLTEGTHCSKCKEVIVEQEIVPAKGHNYGEWINEISATCTEAGTQKRNCSRCGEIETSPIDPLGHDWKDSTCSEPKTCVICKATEGSAKGHTGGTATCEYKARCSVCNEEYGDLAAHSLTYHAPLSATCTANGNVEYWSCSNCYRNYSDADATIKLDDVLILSSHTGGTEIRNYKAPTEHEEGYSGDTYCLGCDRIISIGVVLPSISNMPTITVSDAVVEQGEFTVEIMIFIENNPGIVSLKFDVLYSNMLTIQSIEFNEKFGAYVTAPFPYINPQTFNWISFGEDETSNGYFATITFSIDSEIKGNVVADICIVLDNSNIFDSEMNLVQFDTVNATVTIKR